MKPSRKPELAGRDPAVGERHRRLARPPPGGTTWSRSSPSIRPNERRERRRRSRGPSRRGRRRRRAPRSPGSGVPSAVLEARARRAPWPPRRPARWRAISAGSSAPGASRRRASRDPLDRVPSRRGRVRAARSARRPEHGGGGARAPSRPGSRPASVPLVGRPRRRARAPDPAVAPSGRRSRATGSELDRLDRPGTHPPNMRTAIRSEGRDVPGRSCRWTARRRRAAGASWPAAPASAAVPRVVPGASRPLTESSSARAPAVAVAESTIATRSPTAAWMIGAQERVVGAAEEERVDPGRGRAAGR